MLTSHQFSSSRLGLGAALPKNLADGSWNRTELHSNDQLRDRLLGRNFGKIRPQSLPTFHKSLRERKQTQFSTSFSNSNVESDDEEGRSSLGKSKRKRTANENYTSMRDEIADDIKTPAAAGNPQGKKAGSYLDEILDGRSKKKRKNQANLDNVTHP
jgi:hypothetical protein